MSTSTLPGTDVDFDEVARLFPGDDWLEMGDLLEGDDGPPRVRVVEGSAKLETFAPGKGPWAFLVHGDLHVDGDLDLKTGDYATSMLVVRGNLRCRNLRFTNGANVFVLGNLDCTGVVFGRYGDESARLDVKGRLKARAVLLDHVTGLEVGELDALVDSAEGWRLPRDFPEAEHASIFVPAALSDGELDRVAAWTLASRGGELFLPGAEERLKAARLAK